MKYASRRRDSHWIGVAGAAYRSLPALASCPSRSTRRPVRPRMVEASGAAPVFVRARGPHGRDLLASECLIQTSTQVLRNSLVLIQGCSRMLLSYVRRMRATSRDREDESATRGRERRHPRRYRKGGWRGRPRGCGGVPRRSYPCFARRDAPRGLRSAGTPMVENTNNVRKHGVSRTIDPGIVVLTCVRAPRPEGTDRGALASTCRFGRVPSWAVTHGGP